MARCRGLAANSPFAPHSGMPRLTKAAGKSLEAQHINEKLENIKTNIPVNGINASAIGIRMSRPKRSATPASVWAMIAACCCRPTTTNVCGPRMPEKIRRLGVKIKNLEAAARHEVEIAGPIDAAVRDTVVIRDTVPILRQKVEMITPHIRLTRLIENERLKGEIRVPVTLRQAVWVEYNGLVVLETAKAVHQTIVGVNPMSISDTQEYIRIERFFQILYYL